jgi:hypothetical protein
MATTTTTSTSAAAFNTTTVAGLFCTSATALKIHKLIIILITIVMLIHLHFFWLTTILYWKFSNYLCCCCCFCLSFAPFAVLQNLFSFMNKAYLACTKITRNANVSRSSVDTLKCPIICRPVSATSAAFIPTPSVAMATQFRSAPLNSSRSMPLTNNYSTTYEKNCDRRLRISGFTY